MTTRMMYWSYAAVADAADLASVRSVERITHDRCLDATGTRRRSGVSWRHIPASDAETIGRLLSGSISEAERADADGLRDFLADNPAGLLILAECEWEPG